MLAKTQDLFLNTKESSLGLSLINDAEDELVKVEIFSMILELRA